MSQQTQKAVLKFDHMNPEQYDLFLKVLLDQNRVLPGSKQTVCFDQFEIRDQLGSGSFGRVYSCLHLTQLKNYAMKVVDLRPYPIKSLRRLKILQLCQTEYNLMVQCKSAHVIGAYRKFQSQKYFIIIMEYCKGQTLLKYLERSDWSLPQQEAINIINQIINGIKAMHRRLVIHRDLKLDNIMITNGFIKIVDLGGAKKLNSESSVWTTYVGTQETMAPQVYYNLKANNPQGAVSGLKADIYSLGVIYLQLICSKNINFSRRTPWRVNFRSLKGKNDTQISQDSLKFIQDLTRKNPEQRPDWRKLETYKFLKLNFNQKFGGQSTVGRSRQQSFSSLSQRGVQIKISGFIQTESQIEQQNILQLNIVQKPQQKSQISSCFKKIKQIQSQIQDISEQSIIKQEFIDNIDRNSISTICVASYIQDQQLNSFIAVQQESQSRKKFRYFVECLKAQFILKQLIANLQDPQLQCLDLENQKDVKLMYMLTQRAFLNLDQSRNYFQSHNFMKQKEQIAQLWQISLNKFSYYTQLMNNPSKSIVRFFKSMKIFEPLRSQLTIKKQKVLYQIQTSEQHKLEQIAMTCVQIFSFLQKIYVKSMYNRLYIFQQIMHITAQDLQISGKSFNMWIQDALLFDAYHKNK